MGLRVLYVDPVRRRSDDLDGLRDFSTQLGLAAGHRHATNAATQPDHRVAVHHGQTGRDLVGEGGEKSRRRLNLHQNSGVAVVAGVLTTVAPRRQEEDEAAISTARWLPPPRLSHGWKPCNGS